MSQIYVDASNACIPPKSPLHSLFPPLPTTVRGEPCSLDSFCFNDTGSMTLLYSNGRLLIAREISIEGAKKKVKAFVYRGHMAQVSCARFSPSGAYVASCDVRGNLRVWSYDNEEHLCKLNLSRAIAGPIRDVSWDEKSKKICIVGDTAPGMPCCRLIQWNTGVTCGDLRPHVRNRVSSCSIRNIGSKKVPYKYYCVVTGGGEDHKLILSTYSLPTTESNDSHSRGAVHCVRFSHDGEKVVSVGADKSICLFSLSDDGHLILMKKEEEAHCASIYTCDFNSDGSLLLTSSADGTMKVWDVDSLKLLHNFNVLSQQLPFAEESDRNSFKTHVGGIQIGCKFVSNIALSVGYNGKIATLNTEAGNSAKKLEFILGHQAPIAAMSLHSESALLFTGDTDGKILSWNLNSGICNEITMPIDRNTNLLNKVHSGTITSMAYVKDLNMLVSTGWDDVIRVSKATDHDHPLKTDTTPIKLDFQPSMIACGKELIVILTVGGAILFKNGKVVSDLKTLSFECLSVCVSTDDLRVCIGGNDCNIHVYTVASEGTGELKYSLQEYHVIRSGHLRSIHALMFSPDATLLASADSRDVCVWSNTDFSPVLSKNRWCFHSQKITSLAWFPNSRIIASAGMDDSIYLWSLDKKIKRIHYPFSHRGGINGLSFLNDRILVSVGNDACICQWDVSNDLKATFKFTY